MARKNKAKGPFQGKTHAQMVALVAASDANAKAWRKVAEDYQDKAKESADDAVKIATLYEELRQKYNTLVREYNSVGPKYDTLRMKYNAIAKQYNELIGEPEKQVPEFPEDRIG